MKDEFKALLKKYEEKSPEIIFEWNDSETEARGWVVINSLRGGAAGGGTRMRKGLDINEVISLAKTMEIKFTVSGPKIGGAKSGIDFDPKDPRKVEVLQRWFKAIKPLLKYYYGTGGDLNIDERIEVIPITEDVGVWHPQEGVFNGHYKPTDAQLVHRIGQLRQGVVKEVESPLYAPSPDTKYTVADLITGFGVAAAVKHYYQLWGGSLAGKRSVIQGWGNVGAAAGLYLSRWGVKVIAVEDRDGGVFKESGFSTEEIQKLFLDRKGNELVSSDKLSPEEMREKLRSSTFNVYIPAAASRLIDRNRVEELIESGVEVISCGANVPFKDPEIFFGSTGIYADENMAVIPDFIANCGMARVFAFLMQDVIQLTDESIFEDVSKIIFDALSKTYMENSSSRLIAIRSFEKALEQLV